MLLDNEKMFELMKEYKQSDVFYVGARPFKGVKGKSVDHSEFALSTQLQSDNGEISNKPLQGSIRHVALHYEHINYQGGKFRLFSLYFYTIKIRYAGKIFTDSIVIDRDNLSSDFFELYMRNLLLTQFNDYFVTYHEAESKFNRDQTRHNTTSFPAI